MPRETQTKAVCRTQRRVSDKFSPLPFPLRAFKQRAESLRDDSPENNSEAFGVLADAVGRGDWTAAITFAVEWLEPKPGAVFHSRERWTTVAKVDQELVAAEVPVAVWRSLHHPDFLGLEPERAKGWLYSTLYGGPSMEGRIPRGARQSFTGERQPIFDGAPAWHFEGVSALDLSGIRPGKAALPLWQEWLSRRERDADNAPTIQEVAAEMYPGAENKHERWNRTREIYEAFRTDYGTRGSGGAKIAGEDRIAARGALEALGAALGGGSEYGLAWIADGFDPEENASRDDLGALSPVYRGGTRSVPARPDGVPWWPTPGRMLPLGVPLSLNFAYDSTNPLPFLRWPVGGRMERIKPEPEERGVAWSGPLEFGLSHLG